MSMSLPQFVWRQKCSLPDLQRVDLSGRTVLVTGVAAGGIGLETASTLLSYNPAKLIIGNRRISSAEESKSELLRRNVNIKSHQIECWPLDLVDFESVRAFARRANDELTRLDIAVMNAGRNPGDAVTLPEMTKDGLENTIQTNAVSTVLLAVLLTPLMKKTAAAQPLSTPSTQYKPHLVVVGSGIHYWAPTKPFMEEEYPIKYLAEPKKIVGETRYMVSKLILQSMMHKMIPLYPEINISCVDPGLVQSQFFRGYTSSVTHLFFRALAVPPTVGSKNVVWAATAIDRSLEFISYMKPALPLAYLSNPKGVQAGDRIWEEAVAIWRKAAPEVAVAL